MLITKPSTLLNKTYITLSDKIVYKNIVSQIVKEVLQNEKRFIYVAEIHFCCDLRVDKKIEDYIYLLNRHWKKFKRMKQNRYDTSSYMKSPKR